MTPIRLSALFLHICLLCGTSSLLALTTDKEQALHVASESLAIDYAKGVTLLEGNVKITQGSTSLTGDKVFLYTDKQQQWVKLIAYGNGKEQAHYATLPTPDDSLFQASADIITYINASGIAFFSGNAHASDGLNQFDGPEFQYFTEEQKVVTPKVKNHFSSMTIYPRKKTS